MITINADISDPRCAKVRADQTLTIVNNTQDQLDVDLVYKVILAAGDQATINIPFGDYQAPGVHQLQVKPCCGAEIWLENK